MLTAGSRRVNLAGEGLFQQRVSPPRPRHLLSEPSPGQGWGLESASHRTRDPRQKTCSWGFVSSHGCCSLQKDGSRDLWSAELGWIWEVGAVRTELFS